MQNPESSVSCYVATWIRRLNDGGLSSPKIDVAYAFSRDIHARIVANMFTDSDVYRELRGYLGETPAIANLHYAELSLGAYRSEGQGI